MIDNFSRHVDKLDVAKISEIIADLSEDSNNINPRYKDKMSVTVAGIITAKKTKTTKSGDVSNG